MLGYLSFKTIMSESKMFHIAGKIICSALLFVLTFNLALTVHHL